MDENDLTINLETKDGETVRAQIIMAFADKSRNYIALMPETGNDENIGTDERDILLYRYREINTNAGNGNAAETGGETAETGGMEIGGETAETGGTSEKTKVYKTGASEYGDEIITIELIEIKSDMEFQSALSKFEEMAGAE